MTTPTEPTTTPWIDPNAKCLVALRKVNEQNLADREACHALPDIAREADAKRDKLAGEFGARPTAEIARKMMELDGEVKGALAANGKASAKLHETMYARIRARTLAPLRAVLEYKAESIAAYLEKSKAELDAMTSRFNVAGPQRAELFDSLRQWADANTRGARAQLSALDSRDGLTLTRWAQNVMAA